MREEHVSGLGRLRWIGGSLLLSSSLTASLLFFPSFLSLHSILFISPSLSHSWYHYNNQEDFLLSRHFLRSIRGIFSHLSIKHNSKLHKSSTAEYSFTRHHVFFKLYAHPSTRWKCCYSKQHESRYVLTRHFLLQLPSFSHTVVASNMTVASATESFHTNGGRSNHFLTSTPISTVSSIDVYRVGRSRVFQTSCWKLAFFVAVVSTTILH